MNARQDFSPIASPIPCARKPGPCSPPPVLEFARAQPSYEGADDVGEYAQTLGRIGGHRAMQAEPVEPDFDDEVITDADRLEDVKHDMRVEWQHAIDNQHLPSTPKLPTAVATYRQVEVFDEELQGMVLVSRPTGHKLVMVPVTELVGTLMETCRAVQLLCDALRTGDLHALHLHLRTDWIDGDAQALADCGWAA